MTNEIEYRKRKPWVEIDYIELAYQQLAHIFSPDRVESRKTLTTRLVPSVLVDIVARSLNGQIIVFEVIYVHPNSALSYSEYPSIAGLRDTLRDISPERPPILVVLATDQIDDAVKNVFETADIPIITLSTVLGETRTRLREVFEKLSIILPEFSSDSEEEFIDDQEKNEEQRNDRIVAKAFKKISSTPFIYLNISLVILAGVLSIFNGRLLLLEGVVLATAVMAGLVISSKKNEERICINPHLIIEDDRRNLTVHRDKWILERNILFKSRKKVETFMFRVDWSGSSHDVRVFCRETDGRVIKLENKFYNSIALNQQIWELRFDKPIKRGDIKEVVLTSILPDPEHKAAPYHRISYTNVWSCKRFECRLWLMDTTPKAVYFFEGTEQDVALKKNVIQPISHSQEYIIHSRPDLHNKYSLEWDSRNGGLNNNHNGDH